MRTTTALLGRGLAALLVLSLTPARPALAQVRRTDDDWCRRSYSGDRASYCEVREEPVAGLPTGVRSDMDLQTRNGGLHLTDLGGHVRAETRNGGVTVELTGQRWNGDLLDVETTNGGVRVALPVGYAAHLETGTTNGGIRVDFPITVQGRLNKNISADLNGGGPTIRVMTRNGSVRIEQR